MADKNKVIQLLDPDTGDKVSPVVNVGSIYDKNGNKVDNLLSYKVSGVDVPIPEIKDVKGELTDEVNQAILDMKNQIPEMQKQVDQAILDMKTQVEAFTLNGGLPVNDIRSAKVASGESVSAGDVVDIDDSGCAAAGYSAVEETAIDYDYSFSNQPTKVKVVDSNIESVDIGNDERVVIADFAEYSGFNAYLLKSDGTVKSYVKIGNPKSCVTGAAYKNGTNTFVMLLVSNRIGGSSYSNGVVSIYLTISSSGGMSCTNYSSSDITSIAGNADIQLVSFSKRTDGVLYVSGASNGAVGLYYKSTSTAEPFMTYYGKLGITGTLSDIKLLTLGEIVSGTEGFLISYVNSSDNKTYAAVFTVNNSSNAIVAGTPIVISSTSGAIKKLSQTPSGEIVGVVKESSSVSYIFKLSISGWTVSIKNKTKILANETVTNLIDCEAVSNTKVAVMYSNSNSGMFIRAIDFSSTVTEHASHVIKKTDTATDLVKTCGKLVSTKSGKVIAVTSYSNGYYKLHGVLLENKDDLYGESIIVDSTQAIALESGSSGDTISLGYGGYCRMSSAKSGDTVESNGVRAVSPIDGWLDITPKYKRNAPVTGTYSGNGGTMTINLGFKPSVVISGTTTAGIDNGGVVYGGVTSEAGSTSNGLVKITSNGFTVSGYACSNGGVYTYAAWR